MSSSRSAKPASFAVVVCLVVSLGAGAYAGQTRPRYSSSQPGERTWAIPEDTVISVTMNSELTSRTAHVGDRFTATVTIPVYSGGKTVLPAGALIEGHVSQVTPAKRMSKAGTIAVDFDEIVFPNGSRLKLVGNLTSDDPDTRRRIDDESRVSGDNGAAPAVFVGGGGAVGAVIGGIAGGGKGAVVGGVVGAGAGVAAVLLSKGEEARVPTGTPFGVHLRQELVVRESFLPEGGGADSTQPADRGVTSQPAGPPHDPSGAPALPADPRDRAPTSVGPVDAEPDLPLSSAEMISRAQMALKEQGYYEGSVDGVMGPRTAAALKTYQREHQLPETGDLDPGTARRLGIVGARTPSSGATGSGRGSAPESLGSVLANVLNATARRTPDGAINVLVTTQAESAGWRWFGDHVVNGDTLEVYARAVRPTGPSAQVLTRGRVELNVVEGVEYVNRVVVHGAAGDVTLAVGGRAGNPSAAPRGGPGSTSGIASGIQRKSAELLGDYQNAIAVRLTGAGLELQQGRRYSESELALLFAFDGFANAAQLYSKIAVSVQDREALRASTLALAREARKADRLVTDPSSPVGDSLALKWDLIRQDVLSLMQRYNITASELEN